MPDTDARTPSGPHRAGSGTPRRRRPSRAGWPALLLVVGITAGVGALTVHGGDGGLTASICDALEQTAPSGTGAGPCATNGSSIRR